MQVGESMNLKEALVAMDMDFERCALGPSGGGFTLKALDVSPMEFLMQAEEDFRIGGMSAAINCIANAKRAIASQMDQILLSLGYKSFRWSAPKKIETLKELGLLLPSVLRNVSQARNMLEHEYKKPNQSDVESALDLASLYVWGMASLFNCFGDGLEISCGKSYDKSKRSYSKYIDMGIATESEKVVYVGYCNIRKSDEEYHQRQGYSVEIPNNDPLFFALVRLATAFEIGYRIDEAIAALNQAYAHA